MKNELPEINGHIEVRCNHIEDSITYTFDHTGGDIVGISLQLIQDSVMVRFYGDWLIVGTIALEVLGVKYGALVCRIVPDSDDV